MKNVETSDNQALAPILALHGTASSAAQWKALVQTNLGSRTVYTPEIPGYGQMPLSEGKGITQRLKPLVKGIKDIAEPIHLVAHSFGGELALRLAEMMPEKFISVSLYEPTALTVLKKSGEYEDIKHLEAIKLLAQQVTQSNPLDAMAHFIGFWMGPEQWSGLATKAQNKLASYAKLASRDFSDTIYDLDFSTANNQYEGPLTIFYGSHTVSIAKRIGHLFSHQYVNCQVKKLDGLTHMGPLQQPEIANQAFMQCIEKSEQE